MPLTITDEMLSAAGLSEEEAKLEIACRLYHAKKLSMPEAIRWAGVTRTVFETALLERNLPLVQLDESYLNQELENMQKLGW